MDSVEWGEGGGGNRGGWGSFRVGWVGPIGQR